MILKILCEADPRPVEDTSNRANEQFIRRMQPAFPQTHIILVQ